MEIKKNKAFTHTAGIYKLTLIEGYHKLRRSQGQNTKQDARLHHDHSCVNHNSSDSMTERDPQ